MNDLFRFILFLAVFIAIIYCLAFIVLSFQELNKMALDNACKEVGYDRFTRFASFSTCIDKNGDMEVVDTDCHYSFTGLRLKLDCNATIINFQDYLNKNHIVSCIEAE